MLAGDWWSISLRLKSCAGLDPAFWPLPACPLPEIAGLEEVACRDSFRFTAKMGMIRLLQGALDRGPGFGP